MLSIAIANTGTMSPRSGEIMEQFALIEYNYPHPNDLRRLEIETIEKRTDLTNEEKMACMTKIEARYKERVDVYLNGRFKQIEQNNYILKQKEIKIAELKGFTHITAAHKDEIMTQINDRYMECTQTFLIQQYEKIEKKNLSSEEQKEKKIALLNNIVTRDQTFPKVYIAAWRANIKKGEALETIKEIKNKRRDALLTKAQKGGDSMLALAAIFEVYTHKPELMPLLGICLPSLPFQQKKLTPSLKSLT